MDNTKATKGQLEERARVYAALNKEHEAFMLDLRGYLKFCALNDISAEQQLATIGHDVYGLTEKKACFLPRVSGYAKHLFV